jgi:hypothetical protein
MIGRCDYCDRREKLWRKGAHWLCGFCLDAEL